jgi:hypothetical protein
VSEHIETSGNSVPDLSPLRRTFPEEWGLPKGSTYSAERAAWILEQVRTHMPLTEFRKRQAEQRALLTRLAHRILERKRYAPGDEPGQR